MLVRLKQSRRWTEAVTAAMHIEKDGKGKNAKKRAVEAVARKLAVLLRLRVESFGAAVRPILGHRGLAL